MIGKRLHLITKKVIPTFLLVLIISSFQSDLYHSNRNYGYRFKLPQGWKVVPSEDFKYYLGKAGLSKEAFVEGFYTPPHTYFDFPYMLIKFHKGSFNFSNLKEFYNSTMGKAVIKETVNDYAEKHSNIINELKVGVLYFDPAKKNAYFSLDGTVMVNEKMKGVMVSHLMPTGILTIYFYSSVDNYEKEVKGFISIINSLE